ncbi:FtsX-like permease family protein [Nocardioides caldifontis]|uniref:FtsX-like permease family protein n=1 Tax=Nocardioides caldifontis TaxID=2588938 RepID=UPI0011E02940|nr:FtsX-like permease family protein [Nocardioides caldifontis]
MSRWLPALRMARRDLRRHKVRAVLTCLLVALPVLVATVSALASYNSRWDLEQQARSEMGLADATLEVTPFSAIRPKGAVDQWIRPAAYEERDGERVPVRRDVRDVDVRAVLPVGSVVVPQPEWRPVALATGGTGQAVVVPDSPMVEGELELQAGRLPVEPEEVAVTRPVGEELGLVRDGRPVDDARLELGDGSTVSVVGVVDLGERYTAQATTLVVAEGSVLLEGGPPTVSHLVDLPEEVTRAELRQLVRDAAAAGIALRPRDAVVHPERWGLWSSGQDVDVEPLVTGALVVLVGTLEVVLLVGAAFAVAARRQVRDLGLLSANGGAASDVRRVLLAQGLVLGVGSSVVGVLGGVAAFRALAPWWEPVFGVALWRHEIDWLALPVILVLGSLTSVVAALLPALNISRLTPVAALSGRFPVRAGEARAHRGAFALAGAGLVTLAVGGWATARTFGPGGREISAAPFVAAVGLVLLVAGTAWATPYLVRRAAALGRALPLSGRYAFRDAARHRFRSAAAVVALTVTVAGAVLAGFAFAATARSADGYLPPRALELAFDWGAERMGDPTERLERTVHEVVGPAEVLTSRALVGHRGRSVGLAGPGLGVHTADEATIRSLAGGGADEDALVAAFRDGSVVRFGGRAESRATLVVRTPEGRRRVELPSETGPVAPEARGLLDAVGRVFVSGEVVAGLGAKVGYVTTVARTERPVTQDDLDRLAVHGIEAWSDDPARAQAAQLQYAGLGVAALLCLLVVGVAVGLAAAESRDEVATLSAVGAGPWRRRGFGAVHGLFLGGVGVALGVVVGLPAGVAFSQLDGVPGIDVPWLASAGTVAAVLVSAPLVGWLVTPTRLRLTRRTA